MKIEKLEKMMGSVVSMGERSARADKLWSAVIIARHNIAYFVLCCTMVK